MTTCANCGNEYRNSKEKCPKCGSRLEQIEHEKKMSCSNCGHRNSLRRSRCGACGVSL